MITYKDFLKTIVDVPSEEEFNEIIEKLPPIENLPSDFEFDLSYDILINKLIDKGLLKDYAEAYTDDVDLDLKEVWINDFESLEDLEEVKNLFEKYGWTLKTYEEEKESILETIEYNKIKNISLPICSKLRNAENIKELKDIIKDAYEKSLNW